MQLYHPRRKTAHRSLQAIFLQFVPLSRPRYQTDTSGYNTTCATLERITAPGRPAPIPDTTATPDTVQVITACYYKRYIRVCPLLWIHARQCSISKTMPARRGQLLPYADRWQVLTRCQQYRPGAPAEGSASPPVHGQPGGGFDASRASRLDAWHRVSGQGTPVGTLYPAGSPAAGARRAARNNWRLSPQLFSGFRPIANKGQQ